MLGDDVHVQLIHEVFVRAYLALIANRGTGKFTDCSNVHCRNKMYPGTQEEVSECGNGCKQFF